MEKLLEIVNQVRENKGLEKLAEILPEYSLMQDLQFDSLDLAELTVRCEAEFGVDVFEDGIVTTVQEVLTKING